MASPFIVEMLIRIDRDGNLKIDWTEWRDFFEFCPSDSLEEIVSYWRHTVVRIQDSKTK